MRKRTKTSQIMSDSDRLLLLFENIKEHAIIILDPRGIVDDWNKGAENIFGYKEQEIIGKNFARFFTLEDRKAKLPQRELKHARSAGRSDDDNWLVKKNKSRFWASGVTIPIADKVGNVIGFSKVVRDMTEKREMEQQQEDFITIATHELRTPFTVVKLLLEVLKRHLEKKQDDEGITYFHKISEALNQLDSLLRDLSSVGKMQKEILIMRKKCLS